MMLPPEFTIEDHFPSVGYEQWRALVEEDLKGASFEKKLVTRTYEGINIQPVYTQTDGLAAFACHGIPGQPPFVRGSLSIENALLGADLRQEYSHPDTVETNRQILADLAGGVSSIQLHLDEAACHGFDPDEMPWGESHTPKGVMIYSYHDIEDTLRDVQMIGVALEAGAAFLPAAALLVSYWLRRGIDLGEVRGAFNGDPLAALARYGQLPMSLEAALAMLGDLAQWTCKNCPHVKAVGVDTSAYHNAGATAAQDLAFQMGSAVTYLRTMTACGLSIDEAARQILFRVELGTHHFLAIAKLRAARQLWSRVIEASGGSSEAGAMVIHARTSQRVLTRRDPYVNILRNTVAMFAASLGGANIVTSVPFDSLVRSPEDFSRRVARNTLLILQEESHLNRVIDPGGGSWFLDSITNQLCQEAWKIFQEIEGFGGMSNGLQSGWVADQIDSAHAPRATDIAYRKEGITGVSEFPNIAETHLEKVGPNISTIRRAAIERTSQDRIDFDEAQNVAPMASKMAAAIDKAMKGATIGQLARMLDFHASRISMNAIKVRGFAQPFEELRDAVDAWEALHGQLPAIFLANMGPVAHHTARASYAKNFFEAGGFRILTNDGFDNAAVAVKAFTESGASTVVICSSDKIYEASMPELAIQLKQAGAKSVVLAGNPGSNEEKWRIAGVDRFIYIKCNVLEILREMLREEGAIKS